MKETFKYAFWSIFFEAYQFGHYYHYETIRKVMNTEIDAMHGNNEFKEKRDAMGYETTAWWNRCAACLINKILLFKCIVIGGESEFAAIFVPKNWTHLKPLQAEKKYSLTYHKFQPNMYFQVKSCDSSKNREKKDYYSIQIV